MCTSRLEYKSNLNFKVTFWSKINLAHKGKYSCEAPCISRFEKKLSDFAQNFPTYTRVYTVINSRMLKKKKNFISSTHKIKSKFRKCTEMAILIVTHLHSYILSQNSKFKPE